MNTLKTLKISALTLVVFVCLVGLSAATTIIVDLNDPNYYRPFYTPELVNENGEYVANFTDTFIFTLEDSGALSFTLSERNNHGFFQDWVNITDVEFANGPAPTSVSPWELSDPYYTQSNLVSTYVWDSLAAGTYSLIVEGSAHAVSYPSTHYWLEDVTFVKGAGPGAVPEPSTMILVGLGLLGVAGVSRSQKHK